MRTYYMHEELYLLGYKAVYSVESQRTFWTIMSLPSSGSKNKPRKPAQFCLLPAFTLFSCLAYSSTMKMVAIYSSETPVDFQRSTQHYVPEVRTLHNTDVRTSDPTCCVYMYVGYIMDMGWYQKLLNTMVCASETWYRRRHMTVILTRCVAVVIP
jgi:hypothetical protein